MQWKSKVLNNAFSAMVYKQEMRQILQLCVFRWLQDTTWHSFQNQQFFVKIVLSVRHFLFLWMLFLIWSIPNYYFFYSISVTTWLLWSCCVMCTIREHSMRNNRRKAHISLHNSGMSFERLCKGEERQNKGVVFRAVLHSDLCVKVATVR